MIHKERYDSQREADFLNPDFLYELKSWHMSNVTSLLRK